jgi:hypothetical protein
VVLDATTLSALAGDYATAVDGLVFNVTTTNGKLYWQESGQPFREAIPCADRGAEIECRIRRMRAVFFKADGRFTRLVLKAPGGTYEGNKK